MSPSQLRGSHPPNPELIPAMLERLRRGQTARRLGFLLVALIFAALIPASTDAGGRPLDLPSGGHGVSDDDEDAPETIAFYGSIYEGDAFFWCLDRSCSMGWAGEWTILSAEVGSAITSLSDEAEFGLVAYGSGTSQWKQVPVRAETGARNSALAWLAAIEPQGGSCLLPAALTMLGLAHAASPPNPVGFIVSDGLPFCDGNDTSSTCLQQIPAANLPPVPIHTVYVADDTPGSDFLRSLAESCGGRFIVTGG